MIAQLKDIFGRSQFAENYRSLTPQQRSILVSVLLMSMIGVGIVVRWASQPSYVTLYSEINPSEMGQLVEKLDAAQISYRLQADGTTLQVTEADRDRARGELLKSGLPASGRPGFELFDKPDWGMTDFTQKVNYKRALEGELEKSLIQIKGVKSAKVHLTLPEKSPFRKNERDAEASVILKLAPGATLNPQTVRGITFLISSSVERLPPDHITVMDDQGNILSAPNDGSVASLANRQLEVKSEVEQQLADKIHTLLSRVVGRENVRVEVSAKLNFDRVQRRVETYDPERQAILSEQKREAGLEGGEEADAASTTTTNYETSRSVEAVEPAIGDVSRLSVAVLLNERQKEGEDGQVAFEPLTKAELDRIEDLVRGAMGYDEERGDRLVVTNVRFEGTENLTDMEEPVWQIALRFTKPAVALLALLLGFLLATRLIRALTTPLSPATPPLSVAEAAAAEASVEQPEEEEDDWDTERTEPKEIVRLRERAVANPDIAVKLLRSWTKS